MGERPKKGPSTDTKDPHRPGWHGECFGLGGFYVDAAGSTGMLAANAFLDLQLKSQKKNSGGPQLDSDRGDWGFMDH